MKGRPGWAQLTLTQPSSWLVEASLQWREVRAGIRSCSVPLREAGPPAGGFEGTGAAEMPGRVPRLLQKEEAPEARVSV